LDTQEKTGPWDMLQPHDARRFGDDVLDPHQQERWSGAMMLGGLPYLWRNAEVIRELVYRKLDLRHGDRVLIIGESNDSCGFVSDVRERVGPTAEIRSIDVIERARDGCWGLVRGKTGKLATWRYEYTYELPDGYFDAIAILQGVQHAEDWAETGAELVRVLKPGRSLVTGEIAFGPPFIEKVKADVHIEYIFEKMFHRFPYSYKDLSYWGLDDLERALASQLEARGRFESRGFEVFWGTKPQR
jgi:SAM-dependent methyltransferase